MSSYSIWFLLNCSFSKCDCVARELSPPDPFLQALAQRNAAYVSAQQDTCFTYHDLCLLVAGQTVRAVCQKNNMHTHTQMHTHARTHAYTHAHKHTQSPSSVIVELFPWKTKEPPAWASGNH